MKTLKTHLIQLMRNVEDNRRMQFWGLQTVGWIGFCLITFLSLTVWYETPRISHVSHTIVQALIGAIICLPLRFIYRRVWRAGLIEQVLGVGIAVLVASLIWTALRMQTFLWLAEEYDIWKDFGGWFFGSLMVYLCWTSLYFGIKFYQLLLIERREIELAQKRIQDEQLKRLTAEAGAREAQMKMLRYQLNPHFLFNALNSVSSLVKTKRSDEARSMIDRLSRFLRFSLETHSQPKTTLKEELATLELYLSIEKVRYGQRLDLTYDIEDVVQDAVIPSLITQPIVENALKYAVAGRVEGGKIRISASITNSQLEICIEDDGPGLEAFKADAPLTEIRGVGFRNTEERLKTHYGDGAELRLSPSQLGGLAVIVQFPFELSATDQIAPALESV